MPLLEIGSRRIEYSVVKGASRRYTYFRFTSNMILEVIVPRGRRVDPEVEIRAQRAWVLRAYERAARTHRILEADRVMFDGKYQDVDFVESMDEGLFHDPQKGHIQVRANDKRMLKELVRRWFLKETSAYVVRKVSELAPLFGVRPTRVDTREISKWGYCTRGGRLSFSWQLIALPERLREYVVMHELTHLVEFNHSAAFKKKLASVCPDFRQREKELESILPYDRKGVM
ncbi:MAG: M48 family metallopeptidase [Thaumarchaeota archaeon]|nr:M48 family metallopeptidase [Nitrososphaerota archaeon]